MAVNSFLRCNFFNFYTMNTITINGQLRSEIGKKATRRLRSEGQTPGVIYGGPKEVNFSAPELAFKDLIYTPKFQLAEVKLGDKTYKCVLKDLQFHPVTDQLLHVDFVELVEDKKIIITLPLKFEGQAAGVKAGGRLMTKLKTLKVKTFPKDLKEEIVVNVEKLELGQNIRVEDVKEDAFEILNSPRIPIASVVTTRELRQTGTSETEEGEAAEAATTEPAAETKE